jgi:hypothetical protein
MFTPDRTLKSGTILRRRTIADFATALRTVRERSNNGDAHLESADGTRSTSCNSCTGNRAFTATPDADAYLDMLVRGWPKAMSGMREALDGITSDDSERLEFVASVAGAFPIVPAYLAGAPDCMRLPVQRVSEHKRALTLIVNGAFNCDIDAKTATEYAKSVMRLVAWLHAERLDAAVYVAQGSGHYANGRHVSVLTLTPLRMLGDVFQPERLAACIHPSWLRRAWFAMLELEYIDLDLPGAESCRGGYGRSVAPELCDLSEALPDAESIILLPPVGRGDPRKAVQEALNIKFRRA